MQIFQKGKIDYRLYLMQKVTANFFIKVNGQERKDKLRTLIDEIYSYPTKKNYEQNKAKLKYLVDTSSSNSLDKNDYGPEDNKGYR